MAPEQKDQVKELFKDSINPFKTEKMNGFEILETFDQIREDDNVTEESNRDFKTVY